MGFWLGQNMTNADPFVNGSKPQPKTKPPMTWGGRCSHERKKMGV